MKQIRFLALLISLCLTLCAGCSQTPKEKNISSAINQKPSGLYITDMYTDKSQYRPGEAVKVTIECENKSKEAISSDFSFQLSRFGEKVDSYPGIKLKLKPQETEVKTITFTPPNDDYRGYTFEAYLSQGKQIMDYAMHAVDVSSQWNRYPRMGYLTKFHKQKHTTVEKNMDWLSKFYITGLFYYDHINAHDKPLAGTVDNPADKWNNSSNVPVDGETLSYIRSYGHSKNMMSFAYNLIYGGFDDYLDKGLKAEWGIYKDKNHQDQDFHPMHESFKTLKLWLFDPGLAEYQTYYVNNHKDLFKVQDFDGMILDSLSNRPYPVYSYDGKQVKLDDRYAQLFEKFRKQIGTRVMFNASDGYGMHQIAEQTNYDILFGEIYTNMHPSYTSLKDAADMAYGYTKGERGVSYPAYMHFDHEPRNFTFSLPGVTFTNSVINASGGNHLELGDRNMLHEVHYPINRMKMDRNVEAATRRQYDFSVAYEELLRGPGLKEVRKKTMVSGQPTSRLGTPGAIWTFSKENKQLDREIIHFINFKTITTTNWTDPDGKQPAPTVLENLITKYYTDKEVKHVYIGSPDRYEGILREVPFTIRTNDKGERYVEFTMNSLEYWNMVVLA